MDGEVFYGQILTFFESSNHFFCVINRFNVEEKSLVDKQKYASNGIFYDFVKKHFRKFYVCFKNDTIQFVKDVINSNNLISKCLVIQTQERTFLTKLAYNFEHD